MRKFVTSCVDEVTGYTMVLSEVSYNMAMDWLQKEVQKYGREIFRIDHDDINHVTINIGKPRIDCDEKWFTNIVKFHYDESRGYLMQE